MFPAAPPVPDDQRATGTYRARFEDVTQDGRLALEPVVASIGPSIWVPILRAHPSAAAFGAAGIRPIFTRLVVEGSAARLDSGASLTAHGLYQMAHDVGPDGQVARLFLNMWTEVWAPSPGNGGEPALAGRLFAEHVLTRPFGPPEARRVTEIPGLPLPAARYRQARFEELLTLPEGAEWLEPAPRADALPAVFGLVHTDRNRHVNSLVYPRLFEDAVLRRLASLGKGSVVLSRSLEIAFRKPFFAGEAAAVVLRAFAKGERLGAAGCFVAAREGEGGWGGKASAFVRLEVEG